MIEIKKASENDAEDLSQLAKTTYVESHGHFIVNKDDLSIYLEKSLSVETTKKELINPNHLFYILYSDEIPAGYIKLVLNCPNDNIELKNICQLERIYVLADYIPLKIGKQLMDLAEAKARELKFEALWLNVYFKNLRAIRFYEKNDFLKVGKYDFPVNGVNYKNIVLSKRLS